MFMNKTTSLNRLPILFIFLFSVFAASAQSYISIYKNDNGTIRLKSSAEIKQEESQLAASKSYKAPPKEYDKPKSGLNSLGEIWVDGYCRYRPAESRKSRYNEEITEIEYCRAVYPTENIVLTDDFKGAGTIPWAVNNRTEKIAACKALQERIALNSADGIPFKMYDSLQKSSDFNDWSATGYKEGRKYEFSKSVSFWVKRTAGPDKMYLKLSTEYPFTNGEDRTDFEVNDNGQFVVKRFCYNCKSPMYKEVESGKSKAWKESDWNEITIKKDEFNTVTAYINGEEVCRYQLTAIPIAVRFARFSLEMQYEWEKKKLMYNIKQVTVISYPEMK